MVLIDRYIEGFRFIKIVVLLSFGLSLCAIPVSADQSYEQKIQHAPGFVIISKAIQPTSNPDKAYLLVEADNVPIIRVEALLLPVVTGVSTAISRPTTSNGKEWIIGAGVNLPFLVNDISYTILLVNHDLSYSLLGPFNIPDAAALAKLDTVDSLRGDLVARKHIFDQLRTEFQSQQESLKRLRVDADVIAQLGRIIDIRDSIAETKQEIESMQTEIVSAQSVLELAKDRPPPSGFASRERQLTKQIQDLAEVAKEAEVGEYDRRSRSQQETQQKLRLVDSTRYEDYAELQKEIVKLRKIRFELEREVK